MLATPHLRGPPASRAPARCPFRGRIYAPRMPRCNICNCVGYATRDCPQRVPAPISYQPRGTDSRGRGGGQGRCGPRHDSQTPLATLALTNDPQSQPEYNRRLLWTLDSGAALYVTYRKKLFTKIHEPEPELRELYSFSNHPCQVKGKGTVYVEELDAFIPDVYYIPTATSNLLSQSHLSRALKFQVHHLEKASYTVKDGDIVAETMLIGGVCYLKPKPKSQTQASIQTPKEESTGPERDAPVRDPVATPKAPKANKMKIRKQVAQSKPEVPHKTVNVENSLTGKPLHSRCIHKWHRRLGHASFRVLRKMPEFAKGLDLKGCKVFLDCAVCKKAKAAAIPKCATRLSTRIFDLVHTDIVGPFPPTLGGRKYIFF
ncbi:uncharacterized protein LOC117661243 [Pantherophis guttatus]|uniref:Uncharacterized protein LOC117661243 n=1 Tax=Pantherophis guttatus TaxID=94885 RepID=A0ABM3ZCR5_PANGU|nr:uncharacterized protein LOC117661243 [Pantherophis guttatus]